MKSIEIDTYFGDKPVHIEISKPFGTGESYQVTINKYYSGRVWKTPDGWHYDLNPKSGLGGDDLQILIDLTEQRLSEIH